MRKNNGFTLIELLVVIAIIGILASIVLVSLGGARTRAKDARITADMGQIRSAAEIFQVGAGAYTGLCANTDIVTLQNDIIAQGGTNYNCQAVAGSYCVEAQLNNTTNWWCVDSALRSQRSTSTPPCDSTQATKACQ